MKYADDSIKILKDIDAQGMITWDPEGEQYPGATYYGDPRLVSRLAPETDFMGNDTLGALDAYFAKFRAAGLRTGVTLRPQLIAFDKTGVPIQHLVNDPLEQLIERVAYARKRWGCTLFYIDSTYDQSGNSIPASVFETLHRLYPDVLLIPENENFRYFAYSAPLNSYLHHDVASTPKSVREAYPNAFSVIMATIGKKKMEQGHDALLAAVQRGDILLVNAWYAGPHTEFIKDIYREAAQ